MTGTATGAGAGPLRLLRERVRPDWIDYNGHLNEAYYLLIFSHANDAFMDHVGLDAAGRAAMGTSIYTLEAHISYLDEVGEGAEVAVATQLLDIDQKRMHVYHVMYDTAGGEDRPLAECEVMMLHVDMTDGPKAAPFHAPVQARLDAIHAAHAALPRPKRAGRAIGIKRG